MPQAFAGSSPSTCARSFPSHSRRKSRRPHGGNLLSQGRVDNKIPVGRCLEDGKHSEQLLHRCLLMGWTRRADPAARNTGRFLLGAAIETLFSVLIAPI